jgi:hypothetical protein
MSYRVLPLFLLKSSRVHAQMDRLMLEMKALQETLQQQTCEEPLHDADGHVNDDPVALEAEATSSG